MNRDIIVQPIEDNKNLIIATDCSGSCGQMDLDAIKVPLDITAYYTARVAFMELMSVRAKPISYAVTNFIKDGYEDIHKGICNVLSELKINHLPSITSTETNFAMVQSAVGITVVGILDGVISADTKHLSFAAIGSPLVGDEVLEQSDKILSLSAFNDLVKDRKAVQILPVGSKGIAYKMNKVFDAKALSCDINLTKSAGPSTCVILGYRNEDEKYYKSKYGKLFHTIEVEK